MKKYKLLRWYPGLPSSWKPNETNIRPTIIVEEDLPRKRYIGKGCYFFVRSEIENNPEFWEKVTEKNYEIISFTFIGYGKAYLQNDGTYLCIKEPYTDMSGGSTLEWMLSEDSGWEIHSVRRLSDGEVFTVGDTVGSIHTPDRNHIIKSFEIKQDARIVVHTSWQSENPNGQPLMDILLMKPLFTTEDGVDIYEGDTFYVVDDRNKVIELQAITGTKLFMTDVLFSTKEKAEHYKLMNKKCLSVNQVMKKFCRNTVTFQNNLINIVKNETKKLS